MIPPRLDPRRAPEVGRHVRRTVSPYVRLQAEHPTSDIAGLCRAVVAASETRYAAQLLFRQVLGRGKE